MADNSLYVDPSTGGYSLVDNVLVHVHPSVVKVTNLLLQARDSYIYNLKSGNPLVSSYQTFTQADIINAINICLTPLVNSNDLINFTITKIVASTVIKNRYTISIELILPNGEIYIYNWRNT